ncbi:hypothetical protein PFISCL1PPCAC_21133, partial [Pristionchus fissidentatus]
RSYVLGDRTSEVVELVKKMFEIDDVDGTLTERQAVKDLEMHHGINITRGVLRNLKHAGGLKCYPEINVPDITPQQASKRFNYVHELLESKETFRDWIWSDECIVQVGGNRRMITTSNKYDKRRLTGVRKFAKKLMVWAAITWDGPGPITFLEEGETLGAHGYIGILEDFLLPFIDNWKGRVRAVFQQDMAPCHTAKDTKAKITEWGIKTAPWAPASPDMNPIEYVWKDMKHWIGKNRNPKTRSAIQDAALFYWQNILTKERCRAHITHVIENMEHIKRCNGGPIVDKWKYNN